MSDETYRCQLVSIELTASLSSSDDLAGLTGPCQERPHCEQLRQGDGIDGIHPLYLRPSLQPTIGKVARKVRCL